MFSPHALRIFPTGQKNPMWIILLFICMIKFHAGNSEKVFVQVGNPVFLHPSKPQQLRSISAFEVRWKTQHKNVGKLRKGKDVPCERARCMIFSNGSLRMDSASKNDAGIYTYEIFDGDGKNILTNTVRLIVQDDVSIPVVHTSCTVDGRVKLTCSVLQWDQVTFHWTDSTNHTLDAATANHRTLYLGQHTPGDVVCVASNWVSQKSSRPVSMTCRAHIASLMALGLFFTLPILAKVTMMQKKKPTNVPRIDAENVYVVMHKKRANGPDQESTKDVENFYVSMRKKSALPPDCDVSMHVTSETTLPRQALDGNEHALEPEPEDVYI